MMDEETYQTVLSNWRLRVKEFEQDADKALGHDGGTTSHEYRRARALMVGYSAAIEAAESVRYPRPLGFSGL